jgi:DNA-binding MarR family transcriptional regulator
VTNIATVPEAHQQRETDEPDRLRAAIGRLNRGLRASHTGARLTPSQVSVLFTVVRRGPLGLSELAAAEGLNPTMLSRITGQLCGEGLIRRRPDSADRRAAVVESTAAGRRMRERIHRARARALAEHVEQLSEAERRLLWKALPVLEELADSVAEAAR